VLRDWAEVMEGAEAFQVTQPDLSLLIDEVMRIQDSWDIDSKSYIREYLNQREWGRDELWTELARRLFSVMQGLYLLPFEEPTHFPGPGIRYDGTGSLVPAHEDFGRLIQGRENIRIGVSAALVGEAFADRRAEGKSHVVVNRGHTEADWRDIVLAEADDPFSAAIVSATFETPTTDTP
jgi:hypothetical protein